MGATATAGVRSAPTLTGPKLVPKTKLLPVKTYLEPDLPEQLDDAAAFHTEVFKAMGETEKVSRTDILNAFLKWALDAYWQEKGGRPTSAKDRADKAKKHAEALKKK